MRRCCWSTSARPASASRSSCTARSPTNIARRRWPRWRPISFVTSGRCAHGEPNEASHDHDPARARRERLRAGESAALAARVSRAARDELGRGSRRRAGHARSHLRQQGSGDWRRDDRRRRLRMQLKKPSSSLLALTTAALALPGYAPNAEAWADTESDAGYRFSFYKEGDISAEATNGHSSERYQVISNQFHLLMPRGEEWEYAADVTLETMSGASPWYVVPGDSGKPIQVMSGASIEDTRYALQGRARKFREDGKESFTASVSNER